MSDRAILHCDLNSFFASVECLSKPELRRVPMAVCGDPEERHGIILAKNELAKAFGVQTAETIASARRKCPELVLAPPHHAKYVEMSRVVGEIYSRFTDMIEPFGIDESWLDVTGSRTLFGDGVTIADTLRQTVKRETGLTISVGVSFCKIFAKLGSDLKKPDATTVIRRDDFKQIVWPLPASALLFVGKTASAALGKAGIRTIGELAAADPALLRGILGKLGDTIGGYARGEDCEPVRRADERENAKSVGNGMTFARDLVGERDFRAGIALLSDSVAARLRRAGALCGTVQLQIKSPELRVISRQRALARPTALAREIAVVALELMRASWSMQSPVRALTVTAQNLLYGGETAEQPSLFDDPEEIKRRDKNERIESAMDSIRSMYGGDSVVFGAAVRGGNIRGAHEKTEKSSENDTK